MACGCFQPSNWLQHHMLARAACWVGCVCQCGACIHTQMSNDKDTSWKPAAVAYDSHHESFSDWHFQTLACMCAGAHAGMCAMCVCVFGCGLQMCAEGFSVRVMCTYTFFVVCACIPPYLPLPLCAFDVCARRDD